VWQVVAEFFRRGNLIVVDNMGKISLALTYARMRDRAIINGERFVHAPASGLNPFKVRKNELTRVREFGPIPVSKALATTLSVGGPLAREIVLRTGLEDVHADKLADEDLNRIYDTIQDLYSRLLSKDLSPAVVLDENDQPFDIEPFALKSLEHLPHRKCSTFNEAADEYFTESARRSTVDKRKQALLKREQELARVAAMQQKQLKDLTQAIEQNNLKGQLILRNLHIVRQVMDEILRRKDKESNSERTTLEIQRKLADSAIPVQVKLVDPRKGLLSINLEGVDVGLSLWKGPQDEAERYFRAAKKAKEKIAGLRKAMEQSSAKVEAIDVEKEQVRAPPITKRRERAWYEKFRWFVSSEGLMVLAGRDAATNELLIKKYTVPSDVVLHAEAHGAPFVVVKIKPNAPAESTIVEAAQLAVSHSRLWAEKVASGDAYWVKPDQVSKEAPSGQYLTRGAFMITGKRNYVKGVELRLAIGVRLDQESVQVIGGPPDAIRKQTTVYVEIVPGGSARHILAKLILYEFSKRPQIKSHVRALTTEQVMEFLPSGPSDMVAVE
jgi:predicted ribosome quality control (RQC) complex YloA/Tae2 family protein